MCVEMIDVHFNMISGLSEGTHAVDASSTDCSLIEIMCAFKPSLQHNIVRMCLKPIREVRDILHHYLLSVSVTSCLFWSFYNTSFTKKSNRPTKAKECDAWIFCFLCCYLEITNADIYSNIIEGQECHSSMHRCCLDNLSQWRSIFDQLIILYFNLTYLFNSSLNQSSLNHSNTHQCG